jgi:hypothetical protein
LPPRHASTDILSLLFQGVAMCGCAVFLWRTAAFFAIASPDPAARHFNAGLSVREDETGTARVERAREGLALQPSPSIDRRMAAMGGSHNNANTIADTFIGFLTGGGLGTGLALRTNSSLLHRRVAPGEPTSSGFLQLVWEGFVRVCVAPAPWRLE